MKKIAVLISGAFLLMNTAFAGGILTNTNQSAQFVRMLSRNASTDLDAVYFNPAGLTQLKDGFYFGLHNQSLFQTRTITTTAPLNNKEFTGEVNVPAFPTAFAAYKKGNLAFSLGFGPNGGGGSAEFNNGLPSFEGMVATKLAPLKPQGYDVDINFKGQSVFWGLQAGVSAKINEVFSGYLGVRYLPSVNTYTGSIRNISVIMDGQKLLASDYLTNLSALMDGAAKSVQPIIAGGGGSLTLAQVQGAGYISAAQRTQLEGGLQKLGLTSTQIAAMNVTQVQGAYNLGAKSASDAIPGTKDVEVDTKQTGAGFTPIIGVNISPIENLNIGIKYEHKTVLKLTNDTRKSDAGLAFLKDKEEIHNDIPGIIAAGAEYKFSKKFLTSVSYNQFLDKGVNWGNNIYGQKREIDKNSWELSIGLQYNLTENFAVSLGGMQSTTGVSEDYQSDFSYSNSSNTGAFGFEWKLNDKLTLDAGMLYTVYKDENKSFTGYSETYDKENIGFAFGLAYKIF